jgi:hypothetical protein
MRVLVWIFFVSQSLLAQNLDGIKLSQKSPVIFKIRPQRGVSESHLINTERYCKNSLLEIMSSYGLKPSMNENAKNTTGEMINYQALTFNCYILEDGKLSSFYSKYCLHPGAIGKISSSKKGTKVFFEQVEVKSPEGKNIKLKGSFRSVKQ